MTLFLFGKEKGNTQFIFCDGLWGSSLKDRTVPRGPMTALRNQDEILRPEVGPFAAAVGPGFCVVHDTGVHSTVGISCFQDPIQSSGSVTSASTTVQLTADRPSHTHSHCYLATWRKDPECVFACSLFSFLLSGLHWGLGCMMSLFPSLFWVFFIFNCSLESRLMFLSTHSTFKIPQGQQVVLWYHHSNIQVGVG